KAELHVMIGREIQPEGRTQPRSACGRWYPRGGSFPGFLRCTGQIPPIQLTERAAYIHDSSRLVAWLLRGTLDSPGDRYGEARARRCRERGGDQATTFLVGFVSHEIPIVPVIAHHRGDNMRLPFGERLRRQVENSAGHCGRPRLAGGN